MAEHRWALLSAHGQDAPNQSRDTYDLCAVCGVVKHDYRHNGGLTSPNYPVYSWSVFDGESAEINRSYCPPCIDLDEKPSPELDARLRADMRHILGIEAQPMTTTDQDTAPPTTPACGALRS